MHFLAFLITEIVQVLQILLRERQGPVYFAQWISIVTDAMATEGAMPLAAIVLSLVNAEHHIPTSTPEVLIKKSTIFSYNIKNALMKYMGFIPCLPRCLKQLSLHCDILSYNLKCIHVFSSKSWMMFIQTSNTWFRMYRTHYGTNVGGLVFQVTLMIIIMIQVVVP